MRIYSIKDEKMGFANALVFQNDKVAERAFTIEANNKESMINKFPADYSLYYIGEIDEDTGMMKMNEIKGKDTPNLLTPKKIVDATSIIYPEEVKE